MDYYLGDMARDMPAPEGRSHAVSTDVGDTSEGLMPSLMEIFCTGDEVRFEPVGPEDVASAETDYVNHVFVHLNQRPVDGSDSGDRRPCPLILVRVS
jgi:hypothetical protein